MAFLIHVAERALARRGGRLEYWKLFLGVRRVDRGDQVLVFVDTRLTRNLMGVIWHEGGVCCNSRMSHDESVSRPGTGAVARRGSCRRKSQRISPCVLKEEGG